MKHRTLNSPDRGFKPIARQRRVALYLFCLWSCGVILAAASGFPPFRFLMGQEGGGIFSGGFRCGTCALGNHAWNEGTRSFENPGEAETAEGERNFARLALSAASDPAEIDILVLYTAAAATSAGGEENIRLVVDHAIDEGNVVFRNSGINARLNLVSVIPTSYNDSGSIMTDLNHLPGISSAARILYRADVVMLMVERDYDGWDGFANILMSSTGDSNAAFAVFRQSMVRAYPLVIHELGHIFGCVHDHQTSAADGLRGVFSDSHGHRFQAGNVTYHTVMSYSPGLPIPYFSNPDVFYRGEPTGVAAGPTRANNARTINLTAPLVAAYQRCTNRVEFAASSFSVPGNENSSPVRLLRTGLLESRATIRVISSNLTARAGVDFQAINRVVTFEPGETEKEIEIVLLEHSLNAGPRSFLLALQQPSAGTGAGMNGTAIVAIEDRNTPFRFARSSVYLQEGQEPLAIHIRRTMADSGPASATFVFDPPEAAERISLLSSAGTPMTLPASVEFSPEESELTLYLLPTQNDLPEPDMTLSLELSSPGLPGSAYRPRLRIVLADDDRAGAPDSAFMFGELDRKLGPPFFSLPDGRMLVGFHQSHVPRSHPVRLIRTNRDGTVDPSFTAPSFHEAPDPDAPLSYGWLSRVIDQPDGRLLVVGNFGAVNGELHPGIVRLLPDGEIDPSFQIGTGANAGIWTALVERGGKIVLGGHFDHFNGIPHRKSVRLNPDGTVDPTFRADFEVLGGILSIVRQGEHYLMCGYFNSVNEQHASHIARLNPDGSPDPTFRASTSGTVFGLAVLPDQRFYAWGMFRSPQQGIARFGPDGVIDPEFRPPLLNGVIFDAHPLPDDRVLIAGMFSRTADHPGGIAILHSDGSIDREFDAGLYPSGFVGLYPTGFVGGLQPNADGSLFLLGNMQLDGNLPMRQLLRIRNLPIPPVISTIRVSGGQGQVHLQATRGLTHSLEQSVDFTSWRSIGAAYPSGSTLTLDFEELDAKETKNFYRIRLLPPESGH